VLDLDDVDCAFIFNNTSFTTVQAQDQTYFLFGEDVLCLGGKNRILFRGVNEDAQLCVLTVNRVEYRYAMETGQFRMPVDGRLEEKLSIMDQVPRTYHAPKTKLVLECANLLNIDFDNPIDGSAPLIVSDILRLLSRVERISEGANEPPGTEKGQTEIVGRVMEYISEEYAEATLSEIAERLHYGANYISRLLVKACGMTFSELLNRRQAVAAEALMAQTDLPLQEISTMVGFKSYSGFFRAFRRYQGISPTQFREELLKKGSYR